MKKYNFYAGPAILPAAVIEQLAQGVLNFNGSGLSVAEISHRSSDFTHVMQESRRLVREILQVPDTHEVLFITGGSTHHFAMIPMNFLAKKAAYINTGHWSNKAVEYAQCYGNAEIVASSQDAQFSYIPQNINIPQDADYCYLTSNNTIYGTQFQQYPACGAVPLVADMCSDIFSKRIDVAQFALIHASAQKNLGAAGTSFVIIDREWAQRNKPRPLPEIFDYAAHIAKASVLNTAAVLSVYSCYLTLQWIAARGLAVIEQDNIAKAAYLYHFLDNSSLFTPRIQGKENRSLMNVVFDIKNPDLEATCLQYAQQHDIVGIKGYKTVGGFRASLYNAMDMEGVQHLVEVLQSFEQKNA